jgi:hypothetical protein
VGDAKYLAQLLAKTFDVVHLRPVLGLQEMEQISTFSASSFLPLTTKRLSDTFLIRFNYHTRVVTGQPFFLFPSFAPESPVPNHSESDSARARTSRLRRGGGGGGDGLETAASELWTGTGAA